MLTVILVVLLVFILLGGYRSYPSDGGYNPLFLILVILLLFLLFGGGVYYVNR